MSRNFQGVHLLYTPKTLLPLPWDNDQTQTTQAAHVPPVGKDEARERLVSLMKGLRDQSSDELLNG